MKFSEHFATETDWKIEYPDDPIPTACLPFARKFFAEVMECIRAQFDKPIHITSGYRGVEHNKRAGGVENSQHIWGPEHCAVDFTIPEVPLAGVFDWIRLGGKLHFDQVILERGCDDRHENDDCIHISLSQEPRFQAKEGLTHNKGVYLAKSVNKPEDWNAIA